MVKADQPPASSGYLTTKEAAYRLGVSRYRLYQYIKEGRLPVRTFGKAYMLTVEDVAQFRPFPSGRTRTKPPAWRTYREGEVLVTHMRVRVRKGQQQRLREKLQVMREAGRHTFPGTIARSVEEGDENLTCIEISLTWKTTEMPDQAVRQQDLALFQAELADVLEWETLHLQTNRALIYT